MSSSHPKNKTPENCTWFCSIDIGTSYSGYAFAPRENLQEKSFEIYSSIWEHEVLSHKTPTSVLLDQTKNFIAFGHEADSEYENLAVGEEHEKCFYFRNFKMELYKSEVSRDLSIHDIHGKPSSALQVFVESIKFLRKHFLEVLETRYCFTFEDDVCYTITVPAIWSDAAKQFMKEAAIEAGICETRLVLAYEPEAAALFCSKLTRDRMAANDNPIRVVSEEPYIVVDLGGGTADITVQKISSAGILHNLYKASGGPWGGNQINKVFMELLIKLFGESIFQDFCKDDMVDFFNLTQKIEIVKRKISMIRDRSVVIEIPQSLAHSAKGLGSLKNAIVDANLQDMMDAKLGKLYIKNAYFLEHFQVICGQTVDLVRSIIECNRKCVKTIVLVGGFSESKVVQSIFKDSFPNNKVFIPMGADMAVLKGAAIYGFDSKIIETRICPYTYGIKLERKFNPKVDNPSKTFLKGDHLYTEDCFDKFFEIAEALGVGTKRSIEVQFNHDDESLSYDLTDYKEIEVFSSSLKSPLYTSDKTCRLHGMIRVYPPEGRWPMHVRGRVEIEVTGVDNFRITYIDKNGFTTSGTIDFLSS